MAAPSLERMLVMTPDTNLSGSAVRSVEQALGTSSSRDVRSTREERRNKTRRIFRCEETGMGVASDIGFTLFLTSCPFTSLPLQQLFIVPPPPPLPPSPAVSRPSSLPLQSPEDSTAKKLGSVEIPSLGMHSMMPLGQAHTCPEQELLSNLQLLSQR